MCSVNRRGSARDFHILFVPRRSLLCEQRFKDLGVLGSFIHREEYSLDLIPFDGDLLSMESEGAFKECYLESEQTSLYHAAKGLMTLQALYGTIPQIFGKGECARQVANMMIRMKREFTGSQNSIFPVFDNLLLLDRNVDLLSPLATQLMYEGLIDEIYGIQNTPRSPDARQRPDRPVSELDRPDFNGIRTTFNPALHDEPPERLLRRAPLDQLDLDLHRQRLGLIVTLVH
ncbi:vacuolar protein sorting-associated protein 33A-like isoform X2 [Muntiacus reevesi]|uniref:vacuolar protein sorting-associated protein 33A-like isoform X2 n=1 Tax=Muntiacus reevesi TaxID=9886 RepID=UPI003307B198